MQARETQLVKFLQGTRQFIIPIYQRTYSWTEKQCEQLWNDIVRVGLNEIIPGHFIGSIVYIEKGLYQVSDVPQLLIIDGQQRLATLSLLFKAFGKALEKGEVNSEISKNKINNSYLFNMDESGEKKYKLILSKSDRDTLINILEDVENDERASENVLNNFRFFQSKISKSEIDLNLLYRGLLKLIIIDISLDSNYDNPQLIFESLNSTGLDLSQADLIRNYVLMGLEREQQEKIYKDLWYPMEESFHHSQGTENFDRFMRDYLTIKTGQIPNRGDVYNDFKDYFASKNKSLEIISDIHYVSKFFTRLSFEKEQDPQLNQIIHDINTLKVDVAYPFLLEILSDYDKGKISKSEVLEIFLMVESYVLRRIMCDIPPNSLNKTFAHLISEINKDEYLQSIKAAFGLKKLYRRFPTDSEFKEQFIIKNVYNSNIKKFLFDKLENFGRKEKVHTEDYTLEHIMPQNKSLSDKWKEELGVNWMTIHDKYLHTVGNLTLTGYNPELSDRSFIEKRDMQGGFSDSPIRLNHNLANLEQWNEEEILKRANELAERALEIWKYPALPQETLEKYTEVEEDVEEEFDEDEIHQVTWSERFENAPPEIQQNINLIITRLKENFDFVAEPHKKYLMLYVAKPIERKTLFAVLNCGKNSANVMFRVNPEQFKNDSEYVRYVVGWFFPRETERRISIKDKHISIINDCLEHAYYTTSGILKKNDMAN